MQNAFRELLDLARICYERAPVSQLGHPWFYSICATPMQSNAILIAGLNWGGGNSESFSPQTEYPTEKAYHDIRNERFMRSLFPFLKQFLSFEDHQEFNYANICPFRTPDLTYLSEKDWIEGIVVFKRYLEWVCPNQIVLLSSDEQCLRRLKQERILKSFTQIQITSSKSERTFKGYHAQTFQDRALIALPHPQARIDKITRKLLWEKVTKLSL